MAKYFRNHYLTETDSSLGYEWFFSRRAAEAAYDEYEKRNGLLDSRAERAKEIDIRLTRSGVLEVLRRYASHANNG